MIKEVMEERIGANIEVFIEEIVKYFGEEYKKEIYKRVNNTHVAVIRNSGVVDLGEEEIYVEEEPVCAKYGKHSYIFIPVTLMKEETGNVIFVHQLLHAITESNIGKESDLLNEILIDYMASEISSNIAKSNTNITFNKNPIYESKSFYSRFFSVIEEFYDRNRKEIIKSYMENEISLNINFKKISEILEEKFNNFLLEEESDVENKLIKK